MTAETFATPVLGRQLVRCDQCGRSAEVTHAELMEYAQSGWPKCCGGVMAYITEAASLTLPGGTGSLPSAGGASPSRA